MPKNKFKKSQTHQSQSQRLRSEGDKELRGRERLRSKGEKELAHVAWVVRGLGLRGLGCAWWSEVELKPPTPISISLSVSSFFFSAFFSDVLVFLFDLFLFIRVRNRVLET